MKNLFLLSIVLGFLYSCTEDTVNANIFKKGILKGAVQKGPYMNGTAITIYELNEDLSQTGNTFNTQIIDNSGRFEIQNLELASQYVELKANGFYYNEVLGKNSEAQLTLFALSDLSNSSNININILTNIEKSRIRHLMTEGNAFTESKIQAQQEILNVFGFSPTNPSSSESLEITQNGEGNAILLAISIILQANRTTSDLSNLLADISSDLSNDGILNSPSIGSSLINQVKYLDLKGIRQNLEKRYNELGMKVDIPNFEKYVNKFINNSDFVLTDTISYPETSEYGLNILNFNNEEFIGSSVHAESPHVYSISAKVPKGASFKIILKKLDMITPDGQAWIVGKSQHWETTNVESSNPEPAHYDIAYSEIKILSSGDTFSNIIQFYALEDGEIEIEYYEDSEIPTRTRRIKIINHSESAELRKVLNQPAG